MSDVFVKKNRMPGSDAIMFNNLYTISYVLYFLSNMYTKMFIEKFPYMAKGF